MDETDAQADGLYQIYYLPASLIYAVRYAATNRKRKKSSVDQCSTGCFKKILLESV